MRDDTGDWNLYDTLCGQEEKKDAGRDTERALRIIARSFFVYAAGIRNLSKSYPLLRWEIIRISVMMRRQGNWAMSTDR